MLPAILSLVAAYLLGAIPTGFLLVKWTTGRDVRSLGSGNTGATNVLRTSGLMVGMATLACDIGKGYLAAWLAARLTLSDPLAAPAAALAAMAGHAYPVFLKFRGGKAVATFAGAFLFLAPLATAAVMAVFAIVVAWTRWVSLGSVLAGGTAPLAAWLIAHPPWPQVAAAGLGGAFIVYRHRENIGRLRAGTESMLTLRRR